MRIRTANSTVIENEEFSRVSINYETELKEDETITKIKKFCFEYLDNSDLAKNVDLDHIKHMSNFVLEKFEYLNSIKNSLQLDYFSQPMISVSKILDSMLLSENMESISYEKNKIVLQREIHYVLEQLSMLHGILNVAMKNVH